MAIYTTFFLCDPGALPGGFPAWRLPLAQPVQRQIKNSFTGKISTIETREPEWPPEASAEPERQYQVMAIQGSYEDYLEGRLSPFVRACHHWAAKGLTEVELEPLLQATDVVAEFACPLYSPPSSGSALQQIPQEVLTKISALDQGGLEKVAQRWAATMSTPEYTHSVSGNKLSEGWEINDAMQILSPIAALARKATKNQQMYLLIDA